MCKALIFVGILFVIDFLGMSVKTVQQQIIQYLTLITGTIFLCSGFICIKLDKIIEYKKENCEK